MYVTQIEFYHSKAITEFHFSWFGINVVLQVVLLIVDIVAGETIDPVRVSGRTCSGGGQVSQQAQTYNARHL